MPARIILVTFVTMALLSGCKQSSIGPSQPIRPNQHLLNSLIGSETAVINIADHELTLKVADTTAEQQAGLSNLTEVPDDGMLFVFEPAAQEYFWMKDMLFAIDMVWIRSGKVIKVDNNIAPQQNVPDLGLIKYSADEPVDAVIELNAGEARLLHIKKGSSVSAVRALTD